MPASTDPKPAFGQVWQWSSTKMMLVAQDGESEGDWWALGLESHSLLRWGGLTLPGLRTPKTNGNYWRMLSEAT